ncbi:AAA-like domain-containing protein [Micromonospora carbonacea]|uniref:AAA-like domain-containing protein n=2 Tax=Micromonospora carbonacea TaxID=47853 RepID=A0A1C4V4I1_9ACTN|nr:AAA-like domain-containing protein [Micromonospora carbonacea]
MILRKPSRTKSTAPGDGMPSPAALSVTPRHVQVGDGYAATYVVCGYPAEVGPAWLNPLLSYPGRVDVAVHLDPVAPQLAAPMLKRQRARFESSRRLDADQGRLGDPMVEAAAADAADLAERVARGAAKLFEVGIYVTVHARTLDELDETIAGVRSAAASVLLDLQPATFRHQQGWVSTLPVGVDALRMRRILDTTALAAAFPLASTDLAAPAPGTVAAPDGVLYGVNTTSNGVLVWNRWAQDSHNSVVLARSGAGKSYFVKLEVLRNLYQGTTVAVIDPEDEYAPLAEHVGGTIVQLGQPGVRVNPLDLPVDHRPDTLTRRGLYLHTLVSVLLGAAPPPAERAALDRAITATYARAGINGDPATWTRPAPLLRDLADVLAADGDPAAGQLAARLAPWTVGNFAGLFDGPTSVRPEGHLVVWSLRHLPDELRTVGTLLALGSIWSGIDTPAPGVHLRRRLVVVDEAWLLMRDGEGSRFLFRMAKAARKRSAGLCVVTQDAADVLSTDLGLAVVSNAATQVLMRQSTQSIDAVAEAFNLTAGEARLLLSAPRGEGLLVAGRSRIPFRSVGSAAEHAIAVTGVGEVE